ncbi:MAG TPA: ribonuclease J [Candidatus Coprosoma intestinipullorum]|uniref:Ribonuclease J n=1 Tax=Candidatus Coprosoma intestinipullorum TaxID=2840752 RepID=A0A9D1CY56_9FIRM|nr:ribonuclease J [Candidatus Coprosoma intestinipullorum]
MSKIKIFALGGLNEDGKNMYVVEVDKDIFVFDAGLKYADDKMLGVDYIIPNYDYIKDNIKRVKGVFITHGHDNYMGALCDILKEVPELKIYGTKFTLEIIKDELESDGIKSNNLIEITPHKKIDFGKNSIFPITVTYMIPDAVGYVLYTPDGAIFYTGNFVFDPTMLGPYKMDIGKLAYVGKQGVLCLLSESLYAEKKGFTSPNHRAADAISEVINNHDGRILLNIDQTQIYRVQELFNEIKHTKRNVVILGKRMEQNILKAINMKYVNFDAKRICSIKHVNDEGIIVIISDERERPFSNLKRIVRGYDKFVTITDKDTFVLVSPIDDGMEGTATKILDTLARIGVDTIVLDKRNYLSHHASSEDLMLMIDLMKPKYYMPVIGEYRQQVANANAAKQIGMRCDHILLKLNGDVAYFENGELVDNDMKVPVDDILIDGLSAGDVGDLVIKDRELLSDNGIVIITATLDRKTKEILAGPEVLTKGFVYVRDNIDLIKEVAKISEEVINKNVKGNYVDFNKVKSGIRDKVGKYLYEETECKPMVIIVIGEV